MDVFTEITSSHPLLLEFEGNSGRMIGELKYDLGVYDQLAIGYHLDAPDYVPSGSHRYTANDWIFAQCAAR